jgi:hypothetical protein
LILAVASFEPIGYSGCDLMEVDMRGLAFMAFVICSVIGPATAHDAPQVSNSVKVQLPSELIARLPVPQQPGETRRAFIKSQDNQVK